MDETKKIIQNASKKLTPEHLLTIKCVAQQQRKLLERIRKLGGIRYFEDAKRNKKIIPIEVQATPELQQKIKETLQKTIVSWIL